MRHYHEDTFLWVEKYRPRKIDDCILPSGTKEMFKQFAEDKQVPTLLLCGAPGTGKTTIAKALLNEIGADFIFKNASLEGNIDMLRNEIVDYASSVSFDGGRKYVILDEADGITLKAQEALKALIEAFSDNCGFIFTCNHINKIDEAIRSRCTIVDFMVPEKERKALLKQTAIGVCKILKSENVEFEPSAVAEFIKTRFPHIRKIIGDLQAYSRRGKGKIDVGILASHSDASFESLFGALKEKKFNDMRKWVAEHKDIDFTIMCEKIFESADDKFNQKSIPQLILHLAEYDYKNAFVGNKEVNMVAMLTEIMMNCELK